MNISTSTALTFTAGAALGAASLYIYLRRAHPIFQVDTTQLPPPTNDSQNHHPSSVSVENFEDDDIIKEQLTRNVQFFGLPGQKDISKSFVIVVGLGGVGSHTAHLLLRSGIGKLRIIDFDLVSLSSLNRHAVATRADVGLPKADVLASHFKEILPETQVEACNTMFTADTQDALLSGNPDYVIDAIDNIDTKVALLAACHKKNIKVLCVAGAGAKADPTRLKIVDLQHSTIDPLARSVRHRLKRHHNITTGITVLLSTERPRCGLVFSGEEGTHPLDYQIVPGFRVMTIPVLGTTPAVFGMAAAAHVLCDLADAPITPEPLFRIQALALKTQFDRIEQREIDRFGSSDGLQVDEAEVEVLVRELWRGKSARAGDSSTSGNGSENVFISRNIGHLTLTRWDASRPATIDNLILLTKEEADQHDEGGGVDDDMREREGELCRRVEGVLRRAREQFGCAYFANGSLMHK
jgi:tRNA A37 threonylcarbamoyladenosine dehydratase